MDKGKNKPSEWLLFYLVIDLQFIGSKSQVEVDFHWIQNPWQARICGGTLCVRRPAIDVDDLFQRVDRGAGAGVACPTMGSSSPLYRFIVPSRLKLIEN